jgi:hypothetical protein
LVRAKGWCEVYGGGGDSWTEKSEHYTVQQHGELGSEPKRRGIQKRRYFSCKLSPVAPHPPPASRPAGRSGTRGKKPWEEAPQPPRRRAHCVGTRTNCGFVCAREKFIHPVALVKID